MCALNHGRQIGGHEHRRDVHVDKESRVQLEVGNVNFLVGEDVLCRSLVLERLLNKRLSKTSSVCELKLNRNPVTFRYILHFLRNQNVGKLPSELSEIYKIYRESQFFRLDKFTNQIEEQFPEIVEYSTSQKSTSTHTLHHPTNDTKPKISLKIAEESLIDIEDSANLEKAPCLSNTLNRPHICSLSLPNQCLCRELQGLLNEKSTKSQSMCSTDGSCCDTLEHDDSKIDNENSHCEISRREISDININLSVVKEESLTPRSSAGVGKSPRNIKIDSSCEVDLPTGERGVGGIAGVVDTRLEEGALEGRRLEGGVVEEGGVLEEKETVNEPLVKRKKLVLHKDKRKNVFSWEEIRKHNAPDDCWLVNKGKVYDVTEMLGHHPAGIDAILRHGGTDAERHFKFHSNIARGFWRKYEIGRVEGQQSCVVM